VKGAAVDQAERQLWTMWKDGQAVECVMRSCCAGAELQILTSDRSGAEPASVLRELYPTKSDLYERARMLEAHYRGEMNSRQSTDPVPLT
jgi:hypothetical protein